MDSMEALVTVLDVGPWRMNDGVGLEILDDVIEALGAAGTDGLEVRIEVLDQEAADGQKTRQLEQLPRDVAGTQGCHDLLDAAIT